ALRAIATNPRESRARKIGGACMSADQNVSAAVLVPINVHGADLIDAAAAQVRRLEDAGEVRVQTRDETVRHATTMDALRSGRCGCVTSGAGDDARKIRRRGAAR